MVNFDDLFVTLESYQHATTPVLPLWVYVLGDDIDAGEWTWRLWPSSIVSLLSGDLFWL